MNHIPEGADVSLAPAAKGNTIESSVLAQRRVFICYSRRILEEVVEFETTLRDTLRKLDTGYTVFRDVTEEHDQAIPIGDEWRKVLDAELDRSVCCVVVLIPALFERPECIREVAYFHQRMKNGERCFFFPIVFLPVDEEFKRRGGGGHPIVEALGARQQYDFTQGWSETQPKVYKKKVLDIAQRIHKQVQQLENAVEKLPVIDTLVPPKPPTRRWFTVAAAVAALALAAVLFEPWDWYAASRWPRFVTASVEIDWAPLSAGARLANQTSNRIAAYAEPNRTSAKLVDIDPGQTIPPRGVDQRLERSTIKGETWLRFTVGNSKKHGHVPEADVVLLPP